MFQWNLKAYVKKESENTTFKYLRNIKNNRWSFEAFQCCCRIGSNYNKNLDNFMKLILTKHNLFITVIYLIFIFIC